MPKRTYQPSKIKKKRKYGFRKRMSSKAGKKIVKRRMLKNRKRIVL